MNFKSVNELKKMCFNRGSSIFFISILSSLHICLSVAAPPKTKTASQIISDVETEETSEKNFHITPYLGMSFANPKKLNAYLADFTEIYEFGSPYKISGGPNIGIKSEYQLIEGLSAGARLDYFSSSSVYESFDNNGSKANIQSSVTALPVYLTTSYRFEMDRFSFGPNVGVGIPLIYKFSTEVTGSNVPWLKNGEPTYSDKPVTWFAGGFAQFNFTDSIALRTDLEYRYLASSRMKLEEKYGDDKAGTLLKNEDKENVEVDLSSFSTSLGVTFSL